jgi:hypothetical protein
MLAPLMLPEWQFELLEHRLEFLRASGKMVSALVSVLGAALCTAMMHTAGYVTCSHLLTHTAERPLCC